MKRFLPLILIFIFSITSCVFNGHLLPEDTTDSIEETEVTISGKFLINGALPSEFFGDEKEDSRTAIPSGLNNYVYKYKINSEAEKTLSVSSGSYTASCKTADSSFIITVYAYKNGTETTPVLIGSETIYSSSYDNASNQNITLEPYTSGTGSIKLGLITTEDKVKSCVAEWRNSSNQNKSQEISLTKDTVAYFTMNGAANVNSGSYDITFSFLNSNGAVIYRCREKVNIFSTLETDTWQDNGSAYYDSSANSGKGAIKIDSICLATYNRHDFYVNGIPVAEGTGTFFDPIDIETALKFITSINDGSLYTIYLLSDISPATDLDWPKLSDGITDADSYITINPSSDLKLKIMSYGNPTTPYVIDANRTETSNGRVIYIGEKVELTLECVTIKGGYSKNSGAGIYVDCGKLTLNNKATVKNNYFAADSKAGAGIYSDYGTVIMNTGSEVSYNGNTTHYANGGGIYCKGNDSDLTKKGVVQIESGTKITNNIAYSGGGIKILYGSTSYIKGAEITDNKVYCNGSDNGGGVWSSMLSNQYLEITDTLFKDNSVETGGGGALYVQLGGVIINGTTSFNGNSALKGNAVHLKNSFNQYIQIEDSVSFINTSKKQSFYYEYDSGLGVPYILLGNLTGSVTDQIVHLQITPLAAGNTVLKAKDGTVNIGSYLDRFVLVNDDFTVNADYEINSSGKLALKAGGAVGVNGGNATSSYTIIGRIEDCVSAPSVEGVYSIDSENGLQKIEQWVRTDSRTGAVQVFKNYTFVLLDNIPLTESWTPIGTYNGTTDMKAFSGTIDGNGNTISNLVYNDSTKDRAGLIRASIGSTIKNLTISGEITAKGYTAGFVGYSYGDLTIDNCVNKIVIKGTGNSYTSGFVGFVTATGSVVSIRNCVNTGSVEGSTHVGGFIGGTASNVTSVEIVNCINSGDIKGTNYVGGLVGRPIGPNGLKILNCVSRGDIDAGANGGALIGVLGTSYSGGAQIDYCYYLDDIWDKAVGDSTGATYTFGTNFKAFKNTGTASVFISGEVFEKSDVKEALNAWISDSSNGNDSSYSTYKEWHYTSNKYPTIGTVDDTTPVVISIADQATAPTSGTFTVTSLSDFTKINTWLDAGSDLSGVTITLDDEFKLQAGSGDWVPIGTSEKPFKGSFDGSDYTFDFNYVTRAGYVGIFGCIDGATIKNVHVKGSIASTGNYIGGVVGLAKGDFTIENCSSECTFSNIEDKYYVGGIVGRIENSTNARIINCLNKYNDITAKYYIGGIVGYCAANVTKLEILNCGNLGAIKGSSYVGGIIGYTLCPDTIINNCFNHNTQCTNDSTKNCAAIAGAILNADTALTTAIANCYVNKGETVTLYYVGSTCNSGSYTTDSFKLYKIDNSKPMILESDGSKVSSDNVVTKMNEWATANSTASVTYKTWAYDSSGVIGW